MSFAKRWRNLSGQKNWQDLLDPLDKDLRRYIIHYGEMAQVTFDSFNNDKDSKYAGSSRYSRKDLFTKVGLKLANPYTYDVTKYLYATSSISVPMAYIFKSLSRESWCKESNWMGYVAVSNDETKRILGRRDILVAWRGSIQPLEWLQDFEFPLVSAKKICGEESNAFVHEGFLSMYTSADEKSPFNKASARDQVLSELKRQIERFNDEELSITIVGHSLGGSLATLNAADIVSHTLNISQNKLFPVTAFVFGCPHVGDSNFRDHFNKMQHLHLLRIRNAPDIVTMHPIVPGYCDVGEELVIDTRKSKFLKNIADFVTWHTLEAYLHGVAGTQGEKDFHLEIERDISLVNKKVDGLKDEYLVPPSWWCVKNKGMVQKKNGFWSLEDHEKEDF